MRARARGGGLPGRLGQLHPYARIPSTIPSSGRKITSSSCRPGHTARPPPSPPGRSSCRCAHGTRTPGLRPQTPPCLLRARRSSNPARPPPACHTVHHPSSSAVEMDEGSAGRRRLRQCMAGLTFGCPADHRRSFGPAGVGRQPRHSLVSSSLAS